jgi:hypothetical protein
MAASSPTERLPWRQIALAIGTVLAVAWAIGFVIGLVVRLVS